MFESFLSDIKSFNIAENSTFFDDSSLLTSLPQTQYSTALTSDYDFDALQAIANQQKGVKDTSYLQSSLLNTGTGLHQTDQSFEFKVADWNKDSTQDLIAIKKNNTGSNSTEVEILSAVGGAIGDSYNTNFGYGLVNASSAVAKALGQSPFPNVANLGGNNWGADLVKAPEVWAKGYTGRGVTVAILDTGVDRNHSDLKSNIWRNTKEIAGNGIDDDGNGYTDDVFGWNFGGNNNNTLDVNGHGTHVAGTIAGVNNSFGVTGIAYNAKIMPVKILDDNGSGSWSALANGIRYAADNGAKVINMSVSASAGDSNVISAIQYASSKGAIVVMAAGNSGLSQPDYPASYAINWGVAVGAVDKNNRITSFSNRAGTDSSMVYVTAPGVGIYSTLPNNRYASLNGTSMASPHVAGVVALMLSAEGTLSDDQIRQILMETSGNSSTTTNSTTVGSSSTLGAASVNNSLLSYGSESGYSFITERNLANYTTMEAKNSTKVFKSNSDPLINSEIREDVDLLLNPKATKLTNDLSNLLGVDLETYSIAMQELNIYLPMNEA